MAACTPAPRSASFFEAHPEEAKAVLEACRSGHARGDECVTALAGAKAAADRARLELFRRGF